MMFDEALIMYCIKCGKKNPDDIKFCEHCGFQLYTDEIKTEHQADKLLTIIAIIVGILEVIVIITLLIDSAFLKAYLL